MVRNASHILAAGVVWFSAYIGFLCSYSCSGNPRILSLGNTFGGGVLLAAGLVHLANESFNNFANVSNTSWAAVDYPWAAFFVSIGFLTTLLIEEGVIHIIVHKHHDHSAVYDSESPLLASSNCDSENRLYCMNKREKILSCDGESVFSDECNGTPIHTKCVSEMMHVVATRDTYYRLKTLNRILSRDVTTSKSWQGTSDTHDPGVEVIAERGIAVALVFLCAISCHSFLSGLGVGAMKGKELWSGIIAIVAHKGLATFTLSTCFIKANVSTCSLVFYISIFSFVTPLAILIGSEIGATNPATTGILVGVAGGSFTYIGILEVISKELENPADKMVKLVMLILGWGIMALLAIWV